MTPNRFTAAEILAAKRQNENIDARMEDTILSGNFDHFCCNWHFCSDVNSCHIGKFWILYEILNNTIYF